MTALPPVAVTNSAPGADDCKPSSVTNHPFVASTYTNVTARPSTPIIEFSAAPPILEPFLFNVQEFVSHVFA